VKLDYLQEGSDECPLVRLYGFRCEEIQRLRATFESLASGAVEQVPLDAVISVESVDGTRLTFRRATRDRGVTPGGAGSFDVALTPSGWRRCIKLLEPFCQPGWGYEWLCEDAGRIGLLLSHDGSW
jgi:hypothetical protein